MLFCCSAVLSFLADGLGCCLGLVWGVACAIRWACGCGRVAGWAGMAMGDCWRVLAGPVGPVVAALVATARPLAGHYRATAGLPLGSHWAAAGHCWPLLGYHRPLLSPHDCRPLLVISPHAPARTIVTLARWSKGLPSTHGTQALTRPHTPATDDPGSRFRSSRFAVELSLALPRPLEFHPSLARPLRTPLTASLFLTCPTPSTGICPPGVRNLTIPASNASRYTASYPAATPNTTSLWGPQTQSGRSLESDLCRERDRQRQREKEESPFPSSLRPRPGAAPDSSLAARTLPCR
ncbi:hypothetical protein AOQ84DRAFT_365460 [Glonium stellatum]|uniref:Uncharacterized protein n=1 Tax=Glonium stellatum TaxID=574774 RepID=A0A8E2EXR5_9PEZI|nr:hypothetical protein AOQ84DRAFT_365460 [Glonium stellatum]